MRTPIGKLIPPIANINGNTYSMIFCCLTIGLSGALFFTINCRCVRNVVVVIKIIRMNATTRVLIGMNPSTATSSAPMKVPYNGAPKIEAPCASSSRYAYCGQVKTPSGTRIAIPCKTLNSAKKIGACNKIGKHEAKGLVPVSL